MINEPAFKIAIRVAGGATAVARRLNLTRGAVSKWARCPAEHVLALEEMSGGRVSRHEIRPDVFGPDADAARESAA